MTDPVKSPKKLIEVALPLDAINTASVRESYIYRGNPSSLHKWWAQRPLAAARAVIFAQLVNDPSWKWELKYPGQVPPGHLKASWVASRNRLFKIIEDLVVWENTTNEAVLERARSEIRHSWREVCELNRDHPQAAELFNPDKLPALHDPFAGGGTIPLEAQRLGLEAYASDLNPVAVLINKALIEIPPKFAGRPPVHPTPETSKTPKTFEVFNAAWKGAAGLAEDVRYYGAWMREEAQKRIGHFYPPVEITAEMARERPDLKPLVGQKLAVIAWLWARTVKSPNPAFSHVDVPLASTFVLSSKTGKEVYVQPVIEGDCYRFTVKMGTPPSKAKIGTKSSGSGSPFLCMLSGSPMDFAYLREEAKQGCMGQKLMAMVVEGANGRTYLAPTMEIEAIAESAKPNWKPETLLPDKALGFRVQEYGLLRWADLFTPRQLVASTTFSDLMAETREKIRQEAIAAGRPNEDKVLRDGGIGAMAYAEAVSIYLAFSIDKYLMYGNSLVPWYSKEDRPSMLFSRQALSMVWDYTEVNPFSEIGGSLAKSLEIVAG
ncbi:MAG: DUF1156 domain-containing protein, partial [Anaerolineae bacterium]